MPGTAWAPSLPACEAEDGEEPALYAGVSSPAGSLEGEETIAAGLAYLPVLVVT